MRINEVAVMDGKRVANGLSGMIRALQMPGSAVGMAYPDQRIRAFSTEEKREHPEQRDGLGADGSQSPFVTQSGTPFEPPITNIDVRNNAVPVQVTTTSAIFSGSCPYFEPPQFMITSEERSVEIMKMLTDTTTLYTEADSTQRWNRDWGIYTYLMQDSAVIAENDTIENFMDSCYSSNLGVLNRLMNVFAAINADTIIKGKSYDAEDYSDTLQALSAVNKAELRIMEVLEIISENLVDSTGIDSLEAVSLREIAELCPLTDGFGVYMARGALLAVDTLPQVYTNYCEYIPEGSGKWDEDYLPENSSIENEVFKIYPNPNHGYFRLEYLLNEFETGRIDIFDLSGRLIHSQSLANNSNKATITLKNVESGIYLIRVNANDNIKLRERIIVVKE